MSAGPWRGMPCGFSTLSPRSTLRNGHTTAAKTAACSSRASEIISSSIKVADDVKGNRSRERQTVQTVENAAVTRKGSTSVLDTEVTLHGRERDVADKAESCEEHADKERRR